MAVMDVVLDVMRKYIMGTLNEDEFSQPFEHDPLDMNTLDDRWFDFYFARMMNQVERECVKAS